MMSSLQYSSLFTFTLFISSVISLECWSGTSYTPGGHFSEEKVTCNTPFCYNATADISVSNFQTGGCAGDFFCSMSQDKCAQTTFLGQSVSLCCCSTDRCNSDWEEKSTLEKGTTIFRDVLNRFG